MLKQIALISILLINLVSKASVNIEEQFNNIYPAQNFTVWFGTVGQLYAFQQAAASNPLFPGTFYECGAKRHGTQFCMKFSNNRNATLQEIQNIVNAIIQDNDIDDFIRLN
ncbi:MAG: hypothetical protein P4L22_06035 [Candidatus Babeliales bacterium]|nr:hypothetical protein [Candidatus Babeliales bacterium]